MKDITERLHEAQLNAAMGLVVGAQLLFDASTEIQLLRSRIAHIDNLTAFMAAAEYNDDGLEERMFNGLLDVRDALAIAGNTESPSEAS